MGYRMPVIRSSPVVGLCYATPSVEAMPFLNGCQVEVAMMETDITLVQASPTTRSWLQSIRNRLSHCEYHEKKYWAVISSASAHRVLAYLHPTKRCIRLFLPLNTGDAPHLHPTPSSSSWAERFPSVFRIAGEQDLSTAAQLIAKSHTGVIVDEMPVEIGRSEEVIDVESQDLTDEVID